MNQSNQCPIPKLSRKSVLNLGLIDIFAYAIYIVRNMHFHIFSVFEVCLRDIFLNETRSSGLDGELHILTCILK